MHPIFLLTREGLQSGPAEVCSRAARATCLRNGRASMKLSFWVISVYHHVQCAARPLPTRKVVGKNGSQKQMDTHSKREIHKSH